MRNARKPAAPRSRASCANCGKFGHSSAKCWHAPPRTEYVSTQLNANLKSDPAARGEQLKDLMIQALTPRWGSNAPKIAESLSIMSEADQTRVCVEEAFRDVKAQQVATLLAGCVEPVSVAVAPRTFATSADIFEQYEHVFSYMGLECDSDGYVSMHGAPLYCCDHSRIVCAQEGPGLRRMKGVHITQLLANRPCSCETNQDDMRGLFSAIPPVACSYLSIRDGGGVLSTTAGCHFLTYTISPSVSQLPSGLVLHGFTDKKGRSWVFTGQREGKAICSCLSAPVPWIAALLPHLALEQKWVSEMGVTPEVWTPFALDNPTPDDGWVEFRK